MDKAKTAKISNFWTLWPVIQLIDQRLTSGCTPRHVNFEPVLRGTLTCDSAGGTAGPLGQNQDS